MLQITVKVSRRRKFQLEISLRQVYYCYCYVQRDSQEQQETEFVHKKRYQQMHGLEHQPERRRKTEVQFTKLGRNDPGIVGIHAADVEVQAITEVHPQQQQGQELPLVVLLRQQEESLKVGTHFVIFKMQETNGSLCRHCRWQASGRGRI